MKQHPNVYPLIRMLIICTIAVMLGVNLAGCGAGADPAITIQGMPTPDSQGIITVNYVVTNITSQQVTNSQSEGLSVKCMAVDTQKPSAPPIPANGKPSKIETGTSKGTAMIQVKSNSTYTVSCTLGGFFSGISYSSQTFSVKVTQLVSAPSPCSTCNTCGSSLPQGGGPLVVLAREDCNPTPTDTSTPTQVMLSNIKLYVNGHYYTEQETFSPNQPLMIKVGTPLDLKAIWDGGALDGTGWWVVIVSQGVGPLKRCDTGSTCETMEVQTSPYPGFIYDAEIHDPSGNWVASNVVGVNWVS